MSAARNWTLAIIGLLGGNLAAMAVIAVTAHADQAQIIPAYDVAAAHYDDTMAEAERSHALGWSATAALHDGEIEVQLVDERGVVMRDARVRVGGYQRSRAVDRFDVQLAASGDGSYRAPLRAAGLYDVTIVVQRGATVFTQRRAVEAR